MSEKDLTKDKWGNPIRHDAGDGFDGPYEGPNAVLETLGGDAYVENFVKKKLAEVEAYKAAQAKLKPPKDGK